MKIQKIRINHIPAILWGEHSNHVFIHVHGKQSCKEYAEGFATIAQEKGYQTISFDLPEHGERIGEAYRCDIWNGMQDLSTIADYAFANWNTVSLFACSLGAYFSLNAYNNLQFKKCLFQSPILNMEYLINQMFTWFDVTEEQLHKQKEICTPIDVLRWDYYQYVKKHPTESWTIPTAILYGGKDQLQSLDVVQDFANEHYCTLTISQKSDHPFMQETDVEIVRGWMETNI